MINANTAILNNISAPVRKHISKVELLKGSTFTKTGVNFITAGDIAPIKQQLGITLKNKNLFTTAFYNTCYYSSYKNTDSNSFTITKNISVNGQGWASFKIYFEIGKYQIKADVTASDGLKCGWSIMDSSSSTFILNAASWGTVNADFNITTAGVYTLYFYTNYSSKSGAAYTFSNIQIEKGNTKTDFLPYVDFSTVNISAYSCNLLPYPYADATKEVSGVTFTNNGDGSVTAVGTAEGGAATFSLSQDASMLTDGVTYYAKGAGGGVSFVVAAYDESGNITYLSSPFTWSSAYKSVWFYLQVNSGRSVNTTIYPHIVIDEALEYEPYAAPARATATAEGIVEGLKPNSSNITLISDTAGVFMQLTYKAYEVADTYSYTDALKSFSVDRVDESSKFFGFGISQKTNIKLIDTERQKNITTANAFKIYLGAGESYIKPLPIFYVTECRRDENTNELSITAYDGIDKAKENTVNELGLSSYSIKDFVRACAAFLNCKGVRFVNIPEDDTGLNLSYETGANFEGTETIRDALNAAAEATLSIYYINADDILVFKRLDLSGQAVLTIDKEQYITLKSGDNKRLSAICSATELGDNVIAALNVTGSTQYLRDNPFLELREDIADILDAAINTIGGLTINQFELDWRGNYLLELGDKIELVTKDNATVISYLLNDSFTYDGSLSQSSSYKYEYSEAENVDNPTNLGEALRATFARVDKANKQIQLVASETEANKKAVAALELNTGEINLSVSKLEKDTKDAINSLNEDIATAKKEASLAVTEEQVKITIKNELESGTSKVVTEKGYSFTDDGLIVDNADSEMKTAITDDGMQVFKNDEAVLTANNAGVDAQNLHATTYLIVGKNSRFEDYDDERTGCFWIGG